MREVIELAEMLEKEPDIISASAFQMQPWFDTPEAGCAAVAVSWDACAAQQAVERLGRFFWDKRDDFRFTLLSVDEAADLARTCKKPIVIGDAADGTGSGSAGDSTYVLLQLMEKHLDISACLTVVDAQAVKDAFEAGIGATREFVIGGKSDPVNYAPARIKGIVKLLSDGDFICRGPQFTGEWCHMGKTAVIQSGKIDIVVMENSAFNWDPSLYRSQGIEPKYKQLIIVKSPNAFRAPYSEITDQLYVIDSPGISTSNVMRIPFKNIPHPMYPYDDVSDVRLETLVYIGSK